MLYIASWHCHTVNGDIQSMVLGPDISRTRMTWACGLPLILFFFFVAWADVFMIRQAGALIIGGQMTHAYTRGWNVKHMHTHTHTHASHMQHA